MNITFGKYENDTWDILTPSSDDSTSYTQNCKTGIKKVSLHMSQLAHQAGAYPSLRSMKRLGIFLLPPGWDASPLQGYPQH